MMRVHLSWRRMRAGGTTVRPVIWKSTKTSTPKCGIINNSTGEGIDGDMVRSIESGLDEAIFEERLKGIEAGADIATFDAHSVLACVGNREIVVNTSPTRCDIMAKRFQKMGIKPE